MMQLSRGVWKRMKKERKQVEERDQFKSVQRLLACVKVHKVTGIGE